MSLLSLNTMFYKIENTCDTQGGEDQFTWLDGQLKSGEDGRKFILSMHVFPGQN